MKRSILFKSSVVAVVLLSLLLIQATFAQSPSSSCDLDSLLAHQAKQQEALANFQTEAQSDLQSAITKLYRTGFAYQQLALQCGFSDGAAVEATYSAEQTRDAIHARESVAPDLVANVIARTIGDPAQGKVVFDTFRSEVGFACVTCHRIDSIEMLVGPGLLDIADFVPPAPTPTPSDPKATPMPLPTARVPWSLGQAIAFLRISILNPDAYLMPGYPPGIMPRTYSSFLNEADINNLVAYLFTLR